MQALREIVHSKVPLHHSSLLIFSSQCSIFSCPLFSAVLKQFEHYSFTSPLQNALTILHFIPSYSFRSPEKLKQSLPLPAVFPLPTTAGAAARGGGEQEAVMERAEGSTWHCEITLVRAGLKFLSMTGSSETFDSFITAEHTVISLRSWCMFLHFTGVCLPPHPSATVTWMQWLESQSYFTLKLSVLYHITMKIQ